MRNNRNTVRKGGSKSHAAVIMRAFEQGRGILRLAPAWVPRSFCVPGRRIKLHPDDYYALGGVRGGIDERWFASTTPADNGPLTSLNEGLSHVVMRHHERVEMALLRDAVAELKDQLIGRRLWSKYRCWPMYSKFFDNQGPLPHHIHHRDKHAALVGQMGKPEAYYFPPQVNNHGGDFPYTFFGLEPGTTRQQVRQCLSAFTKGDNHITSFSKAYRLRTGTGWNVPPGVRPHPTCWRQPVSAATTSSSGMRLSMIFIIETKSHRGRVSFSGGKLLLNGKPFTKNYLSALSRNIRWIRQFAHGSAKELWFIAFIVFPRASVQASRLCNGIYLTPLSRLIEAAYL